MSYTTKPFHELSLIDDFLSNAISSDQNINTDFYKTLIPALLQRDIDLSHIHIRNQFAIQGTLPYLRGIRLDVEIGDNPELGVLKNVFDLEPHTQNDSHFPRQNRFYQAKIDSKLMRSGENDFSKLPNLFVMMITDFDIFHEDYMVYTFKNQCVELPSLSYDDGLMFMYFYTKGTKGGSQALKNVLTYYQDSTENNAVDDITRKLHTYVSKVKNPELEDYYMTLGERLDRDNARLIKETTEKDMYTLLRSLHEEGYSSKAALSLMKKTYPDYEKQYTAYINEHWKDKK